MTFKTQLAADVTAVFFNTDEFGRAVTYVTEGGEEISTVAIRELGDTANPGGFGGQMPFSATYHVKSADIADPKPMELIYDGTEKWRVTDRLGGTDATWLLRCELVTRARG